MRSGRESIGTAEELHDAARRITELDDFGGDEYLEGLGVLLESYEGEARLTPWGYRINHAILRGALIARLLGEAARTSHPEWDQQSTRQPIIVTGLPRTGTTALHRLLCGDPAHQGLELWLTEAPQPRPARETWDSSPVFRNIQERLRNHYVENPEFMGVHEISADIVEECWQLLRQSMMSVSHETLAHVPTYSSWLWHQDWTPAYQQHRKNLQLIGLNDNRRWVLKNPSHLFALPAIRAVYPDALIVQTHRDPRDVIASACSLSSQATTGQSEIFTGEVIGRGQLDLWARGAERFMADRARCEPTRFFDVRYENFVADPLTVVQEMYEQFGLQLSDGAREAMARLLAEGRGARPVHRYDLSDFGLTRDEVDERFKTYRRAYLE